MTTAPCQYDEDGYCYHLGVDIAHNERRQVYVYNNSGTDVIDYFSDIEDWEAHERQEPADMPEINDEEAAALEWMEKGDPDADLL